jgi:hypothetical protein
VIQCQPYLFINYFIRDEVKSSFVKMLIYFMVVTKIV